jgi:formamidopyrimidine-DNA glycosylase
MPELPEVEVRFQYLRRHVLGQTIARATISAPNMLNGASAAAFVRNLRGRRMVDASRRGKYLLVKLDDGRFLILHFGMGGDLVLYDRRADRPVYTRLDFELIGGKRLAFTCPRKICRVMLVDNPEDVPALRDMGPEPLARNFSLAHLERIIEESPRRRIKPLLMDQRRIAGVGNIYADEILFQAGVLPHRRASSLDREEIKRIQRETRRVLRKALRTADQEELPSDFIVARGWDNLPCPRCGSGLSKQRVGGRTSHYCCGCQS